MGKFSLKGLKGGLKGLGGKAKVLGGKARIKGSDAFGKLKQKWKGKLSKSSGGGEESTPVGAGGGGEEQEEKKSIFGKVKDKYSGWSKKRSEAARIKKYHTVRKCPKCGQMHTGAEPCPATGKPEPEAVSGAQPGTEAKGKRISFQTGGIGKKIGGLVASGVMMGAAYGGAFLYFPEFAQLVLIVGAIAMAFIIISMFINVKGAGGYLFLGFITISGLVLYQLGFLAPFIDEYFPIISDALGNLGELVGDMWYNTQCMISDPSTAQACIRARKKKGEEKVTKLGPIETLELKWGRRLNGDYDYDLPEQDSPYTLDITLVNKNEKVYTINITDTKASTTSGPLYGDLEVLGSSYLGRYDKYTLDPKEELPIRIKFIGDDWDADGVSEGIGECTASKNFKINVTTEQRSGGWSDFGMAPSDEDEFRKFIHGFDPDINAEPGPINMYVFTDPYGIDTTNFPVGENFEIVIKIQNKVKTGTAYINDFYLIQEFEVPDKLFDIKEATTCDIVGGLRSYATCECLPSADLLDTNMWCSSGCAPERQGSVCGSDLLGFEWSDITLCQIEQASKLDVQPESARCSGQHNCLRFEFRDDNDIPTPYRLNPNEKLTISCNATVNNTPDDEYTDQIRVFADFGYVQEWTKAIPCLI